MQQAARATLIGLGQESEAFADEEGKLNEQLEAVRADLSNLEKQEGLQSSLQREVDWYDGELESTRERLRWVGARSNVQMAAQIVSRAEAPARPVSRLTAPVLALVVLVMVALGLGTVVVWDHLEDTLASEAAVRQLGLPVLGRVGEVDWRKVDERLLLEHTAASETPSPTGEAFRMLRTNLAFAAAGIANSAIMVTSGSSGDGKTFVSLHLAAVIAQGGGRTLLIDGDMRRPAIQRVLGLAFERGLSDLLAGLASLEEVVQPIGIEGIELLPCGRRPPNPSDLLVRGHFEAVLAAALERYESVIIDAPPAWGIADASIMAAHCKGVLHVVRFAQSHRRASVGAIEQLDGVGARSLGVVVNAIPKLHGSYGYGGDYASTRSAGEEPERGRRGRGQRAVLIGAGAGDRSPPIGIGPPGRCRRASTEAGDRIRWVGNVGTGRARTRPGRRLSEPK